MSKKNKKKKNNNSLLNFNLSTSTKVKLAGACIVAVAGMFGKDWALETVGVQPAQTIAADRPAVAGTTGTTATQVPAPTNSTQKTSIAAGRPAVATKASTETLNAPDARNVKYEMPATQRGELVIEHTGFVLSYNKTTNCPNWVAWELTADEAAATGARSDVFQPDPKVEARYRVTTDDYKNSGYDRGHMCPAADMKWSAAAQTECFYMTNMCPQLHTLNAGGWSNLENACRRWAKQEGNVYVACGPIYRENRKEVTIGSEHKVRVPDAFFKVVLSLKPGDEKAIGFVYDNSDKKQSMESTMMTVDEVEAMTGYDFFNRVDNKIEKRVEAMKNLREWN